MAISAATIVTIFGLDYGLLVPLPAWLLGGATPSTPRVVGVAVVVGAVHSWLMYSLSVYSMHEAAAHKLVFPPTGPITRVLHAIAANLARFASSEPKQYAEAHMIHHAKFGTEQDAEFLNYVQPRRYWPTFLPLAFDINYTDFIVHRPLEWTRDRLLSAPFVIPYQGLYAWYAWTHFGWLFTLVAFGLMLPHVGFVADRLRQFNEHTLMPLENKNGSPSFGIGFWGLFVGGGPWGSPTAKSDYDRLVELYRHGLAKRSNVLFMDGSVRNDEMQTKPGCIDPWEPWPGALGSGPTTQPTP